MPALTEIFGDDACLQFGGGTLGHPWGNAVWILMNCRVKFINNLFYSNLKKINR